MSYDRISGGSLDKQRRIVYGWVVFYDEKMHRQWIKESHTMLIKGSDIETKNKRKPYPLGDLVVQVKHFVVRVTMPDNPFKPHKHEQPELWYIQDGEATVSLDGADHVVEAGDLIRIEPWVEHGLRSESQATWVCLG
jgi:quercetin dioxygenase-like cupin family protein